MKTSVFSRLALLLIVVLLGGFFVSAQEEISSREVAEKKARENAFAFESEEDYTLVSEKTIKQFDDWVFYFKSNSEKKSDFFVSVPIDGKKPFLVYAKDYNLNSSDSSWYYKALTVSDSLNYGFTYAVRMEEIWPHSKEILKYILSNSSEVHLLVQPYIKHNFPKLKSSFPFFTFYEKTPYGAYLEKNFGAQLLNKGTSSIFNEPEYILVLPFFMLDSFLGKEEPEVETLNYFLTPTKELNDYLIENDVLSKNSPLSNSISSIYFNKKGKLFIPKSIARVNGFASYESRGVTFIGNEFTSQGYMEFFIKDVNQFNEINKILKNNIYVEQ